MHYAIIASLFFVSIYQTARRGPGATFVYIFLPVLLLLAVVRPIQITPLPDISSPLAVTYGALVGMILRGRLPSLRLHWVDGVVTLCSLTVVITGYLNGEFWTLVSASGNELLRWIMPYFMARLAFREPRLRRHMAIMLAFIAMAMAFMALIEFRLWPLFFSRLLASIGLSYVPNQLVLARFGFFRAMVTAEHPIDLGNVGLILTGMIPALAICGGLRLRDWRILGGTIAAFIIVGAACSFSSFMGLAAGMAVFFVLRYVRTTEMFLVPVVLASIVGAFMFTSHLLSKDLEALRPLNADQAFDGSFYVRVLIVQNSWNNVAKDAGWFGFGDLNITKEVLGLDSVDNSYMLFLMRRGWVHLVLRLILGVMIAWLGMKMLQRTRSPQQRLPVAASVGVLLGTMAAMYTVWFGFVYAVLWTCLLGMFVTMRQLLQEQRVTGSLPLPAPQPMPLPRRPMGNTGPDRPLVAHPAAFR